MISVKLMDVINKIINQKLRDNKSFIFRELVIKERNHKFIILKFYDLTTIEEVIYKYEYKEVEE